MTPGQFLRLIWPSSGFYCLAHPFTPQGSTNTVYAHKVFPTISEAVTHVHEMMHTADTFFAVLSMREERVWDPNKDNYQTGEKGAWATRLQSNMLAGKALFWDLDVGPEPTKYDSQQDALEAMRIFLARTALPLPLMVSSGGGIHAYWPFERDLPVLEWRDLAYNMRQLGEACGVKLDPTRTIDTSSVLRVLGTFNWKDKNNAREVVVLQDGGIIPLDDLSKRISDALIKEGITAAHAPIKAQQAPPSPFGEQTFNDFGPPPTLGELAQSCNQVQEIIRYHGDAANPQLDNTAWYRGMLATVSHVEGGDDWCRKLTALKPRDNADIEAKLLQLKQFPPARCETLASFMPWKDTPCQTCRFRVDPSVPNPLAATRKTITAPPPVVEQLVAPGLNLLAASIPNPPKPYERLKEGKIAVTRKDKDGNESTTIILNHDLYPLRRLVNGEAQMEQQVWRATIPRAGSKDFVIDADVLYDSRKFAAALAHSGIYPNKADLPTLQDYMVAYISQLQRELDAETQVTHLGWTDDYHQFVLPDKTLLDNGSIRVSTLSEGAKRATQFMGKRGDFQQQVALMAFYNDARYTPNQFAILASFASIIFHATGHHGVVLNMSGESGASKSTTLYTGASAWGIPKLFPINGTNRGATANARSQRQTTNANIPTMVDEITNMPLKEVIDMVMSATQPGHRLRLGTDGQEKAGAGGDNYKSAIMIATANTSLHSVLSTDNAAGTAGSMRVFEMKMAAQHVHTKQQADEFLRSLEQHHGHLGEVFASLVVKQRIAIEHRVHTVMKEIDAEGSITGAERYWSAVIACCLVAGELCGALRILPFDVVAIRQWALKVQIPYMRGVVKEEYRDPLAILTDYIAQSHNGIVVVGRATGIGVNTTGQGSVVDSTYTLSKPHGGLLGHYDTSSGVLYLLKQGFKDHCSRVGSSSSRILDELNQARLLPDQTPRRIVIDRAVRRTLGAGTDMAKGQTWCFAVDMTHPEIAGIQPALAASGGNSVSAPAGTLYAVK